MTEADFIWMLESLAVWKRAGAKAIHKPLLVLFALEFVEVTKSRLMVFADVEPSLAALLETLGPTRKVYHPEYPFWRLISSDFWQVQNADEVLPSDRKSDPSCRVLIEHDVRAGFSDTAYELIISSPEFASRIRSCLYDRLNLSDEDRSVWATCIADEVKKFSGK